MRQLTDEDCCPRQEQHQIIYPTHSGMIPNYTGHLPGNCSPARAYLILLDTLTATWRKLTELFRNL